MSEGVTIFLFQEILCGDNRAQFQRGKEALNHGDVVFLTRRGVCSDLEVADNQIQEFGESVPRRALFPFWLIWKSLLVSHRDRVDYVHTDYTGQIIFAGFILQVLGFTWVADIFDSPHFARDLERTAERTGRIAAFYNIFFLQISRRSLKRADLIIVAMVPEVLSEYGVSADNENVLTITNGTHLNAFEDTEPNDSSKFRLVYVGPIRRERGLGDVFHALEDLDGNFKSLEIRCMGPIRNYDEKWLIRHKNRFEDIEITVFGYVKHEIALKEIANADICLCPLSDKIDNYRYSYPIKILEYMAAGKATIATRHRGTEDLINHRETGLLVQPGDSEAWGNSIRQLYRHDRLRSEMGARASDIAKNFDWKVINKEIRDRIEQVTE